MKPLDGITVVSIEQAVAAPLCTARLAEAGARVIKIERPSGDFARLYDDAAKGDSSYFIWINQGKDSVVLDIKDGDDASVLEGLVANADILVQNLGPGALDRAGFGSKRLRNDYPRLITCDISGYGDSEKMVGMKAYDLLIQAESGIVGISGGENELGRVGISICDIGAGVTAHAAIMEALFLREKTGEGSSLKISLFDVAAEWMTVPLVHSDYGKGAPKRMGLKHPSVAPYGAYETGDQILTILSIQNEREWLRLCEQVLGRKELASDPRFNSNNSRVANRDALEAEISSIVGAMTSQEFRNRLLKAAIAYGAVNSVEELSKHPALRRKDIKSSNGEIVSVPASPVQWVGNEVSQISGAPQLGAQTDPVKKEVL